MANLLKAVNGNTAIDVKFVRREIQAGKTDLFDVPFLYMTGHHNFVLSETEVENLGHYLLNGGFLLADACCGRRAFDRAFRREIARVLPGRALEAIPPDDPLFSGLYQINQFHYTLEDTSSPPAALGIKVDGYYVVVYSPVDFGNGWEGEEHPFVNGLTPEDSLKLGMNTIMYALTH